MELDRQSCWSGKVTRDVTRSRVAASLWKQAYQLLVPLAREPSPVVAASTRFRSARKQSVAKCVVDQGAVDSQGAVDQEVNDERSHGTKDRRCP